MGGRRLVLVDVAADRAGDAALGRVRFTSGGGGGDGHLQRLAGIGGARRVAGPGGAGDRLTGTLGATARPLVGEPAAAHFPGAGTGREHLAGARASGAGREGRWGDVDRYQGRRTTVGEPSRAALADGPGGRVVEAEVLDLGEGCRPTVRQRPVEADSRVVRARRAVIVDGDAGRADVGRVTPDQQAGVRARGVDREPRFVPVFADADVADPFRRRQFRAGGVGVDLLVVGAVGEARHVGAHALHDVWLLGRRERPAADDPSRVGGGAFVEEGVAGADRDRGVVARARRGHRRDLQGAGAARLP